MTNEQIKQIALANGFVLKHSADGKEATDLHPYVYSFARELLAAAPTPPAPEVEPVYLCEVDNDRWLFCSEESYYEYKRYGATNVKRLAKFYSYPTNSRGTNAELVHAVMTAQIANDGLRNAIKSITELLRNREWAEHVSSDPDVADLEAQITATHGELSGLRKAAEELCLEYSSTITYAPEKFRLLMKNLRAELNKDKSC